MATLSELYEAEREVRSFGIDVPEWVEQDIDTGTVAGVCEGGCASGSYMPAVTYYTARETMGQHGDEVLQFIQDHYGELPQPSADESWSGIAVFYLSIAVELWCSNVAEDLDTDDDDDEEAA